MAMRMAGLWLQRARLRNGRRQLRRLAEAFFTSFVIEVVFFTFLAEAFLAVALP